MYKVLKYLFIVMSLIASYGLSAASDKVPTDREKISSYDSRYMRSPSMVAPDRPIFVGRGRQVFIAEESPAQDKPSPAEEEMAAMMPAPDRPSPEFAQMPEPDRPVPQPAPPPDRPSPDIEEEPAPDRPSPAPAPEDIPDKEETENKPSWWPFEWWPF
jgi:hypothetical protein